MSKLALLGGKKAIEKEFAPYTSLGKKEKNIVLEVLDTGSISGFYGSKGKYFLGGKYVRKFEEKICELWGCKFAITVNSNTSGLDIAMGAIGASPGDEVLTTPWSMSATAMSILRWGCIPKFIDIEEDTFSINPDLVEKEITSRTKAIMVTNLFGHPAHLRKLREIADRNKIYLIEDNAQSPLAKEFGQCSGTIGHIGVLSFNYHKHIHTGEGGCCLTNDKNLAERLQLLRNHGEAVIENDNKTNFTNIIGSNFRMTEIQAAIGLAQCEDINKHISKRVEIAEFLSNQVVNISGIQEPIVRNDCNHVYYCWGIKIDEKKLGISREILSKALNAEGFPHGIGYIKPLYQLPMFKKKIAMGSNGFPFNLNKNIQYKEGMCPVVEKLHNKEFLLFEPCAYDLNIEDKNLIRNTFDKIFDNLSELKKLN